MMSAKAIRSIGLHQLVHNEVYNKREQAKSASDQCFFFVSNRDELQARLKRFLMVDGGRWMVMVMVMVIGD